MDSGGFLVGILFLLSPLLLLVAVGAFALVFGLVFVVIGGIVTLSSNLLSRRERSESRPD